MSTFDHNLVKDRQTNKPTVNILYIFSGGRRNISMNSFSERLKAKLTVLRLPWRLCDGYLNTNILRPTSYYTIVLPMFSAGNYQDRPTRAV